VPTPHITDEVQVHVGPVYASDHFYDASQDLTAAERETSYQAMVAITAQASTA
jgi:hypothetical protein